MGFRAKGFGLSSPLSKEPYAHPQSWKIPYTRIFHPRGQIYIYIYGTNLHIYIYLYLYIDMCIGVCTWSVRETLTHLLELLKHVAQREL